MQAAVWWLAVCFVCGVGLVALAAVPAVASANGSSMLGGSGRSPLESPLVVAEAKPLVDGEGVSAAKEARDDSPEATPARESSPTEFENWGDNKG